VTLTFKLSRLQNCNKSYSDLLFHSYKFGRDRGTHTVLFGFIGCTHTHYEEYRPIHTYIGLISTYLYPVIIVIIF